MSIGRAADDDGVDCRIGKDRGLRSDRGTMAARQPRGRGGIDIDDRAETSPGVVRDILRVVDDADTARAELAKADRGPAFGYCPKPTIRH